MKTLTCLIGLFLTLHLARAQEVALKATHEISHAGVKRQMSVVQDEVSVKQPDGRRVIQKVTPGDLRAEAKKWRAKSAVAAEVEIILTEQNEGPKSRRGPAARHYVTRQLLVKLQDGVVAKTVAKSSGLQLHASPAYAPGYVILNAATSEDALSAMEALRNVAGVVSADVLLATQKAKKFIPNDPLFNQQWHHRNASQLGGALWIDANITTAWDSFKGTGITIGIIDDGLEHAHPDIQPNYNTAIDFDYNGNDADPTPVDLVEDRHGTACAGVAGARGNNGIGVSGAAPEATLAGFRLIAAANTDQNEADAFAAHNDVIHVKSNSWGTPDASGYGGMGPLAAAALEAGVTTGRGGKGVVYVFAGGNGLNSADDSNLDGYANNPWVIAVGAVNDDGFQSYYSEPGANLLISAPSNSGGKHEGIRTTDLTGEGGYNNAAATTDLPDRNYTNDFGGTSSACPLVSGIVALMLQANPNLGWRDVKEILIRTARKVQMSDPDWITNAAGFSFNHKYGAGLIDASAAVALAQQWTNLPAMTTTEVALNGLTVAIPDNSAPGVSQFLNFTAANFRVEHVSVTLTATHTAVGDLEVTLTSPSGMTSKLVQMTPDGTDNLSWTFGSVRHWGENAAGNWTVKVADRAASDTGTLTSVKIKLYGTSTTAPRIAGTTASFSAETNTPTNFVADPREAVTFSVGLKNIGATATTSAFTATLLAAGAVYEPSAAQNYGALTTGTSASRTFSFRLNGCCGTAVPLLLKLQDGATDLGFVSVNMPLGYSTSTTFTGGAITINDNAAASPSPSNLVVSGLIGRVQNVNPQINGLTHAYIDDVGALLRGPDALKIRLFNGGTTTPLASVNLSFVDDAATLFPFSGPVPTGSYRTWDYYSSRVFTGDSTAEIAYTLGEYRGLQANGTWRLFMQDFAAGDAGSAVNWRLVFTTVTCSDNVMLTQATTTGAENGGSVVVSVTRTGGNEGSATVNYATSNGTATAGSDYTATSGTLSFAVGEYVKTFSIPVQDDTAYEGNETINLTLSAATGNATLGTLSTGTVTLTSDELPTPVSISPTATSVTEAATTVTFTVSREAALGYTGTVAYATSNGTATAGTDYTAASGSLSFAAADLSKTFTVSILHDTTLESDETFNVTLSSPSGGVALGSPSSAVVTILDNDTPVPVSISPAPASVTEAATTLTFTVSRATLGNAGNISYATSNGTATSGSDYTATSGTLSFLATDLSKTFTVPVLADTTPEGAETFTVTLSTPTGGIALGSPSSTTVTIQDDDAPTPLTISTAATTVNEAATALTFTVSRTAALGAAGTVAYATSNGTATSGSDYTTTSGTLTFAAADLSKTFTVNLLNDSVFEDDEAFTVALSSPTGGLSLGATSSLSITLREGDTDGDTLPDDYENANGLNAAASSDALLDFDGDGYSNRDEFILGFLPNNGASRFLLSPLRSGADNVVSFTSFTGRTYKVERSESLQGAWTLVQQNIAGNGSTLNVTDAGGGSLPRSFYRVVVTKP